MIRAIAFDADDTLWINEPYFKETEDKFCALLEDFLPMHNTAKELFATEMKNLVLYGYGIKGFMLSMIETALNVCGDKTDGIVIEKILSFGKELLAKPVELLPGVENLLSTLQSRFRLVVATKGDLLDQERKLKQSGLLHYFHHIEIMSDKQEADYKKLIKHLDIAPEEFLMIGNSLKSDVIPVLALGGHAVHVPYHTTWAHEHVDHTVDHPNFKQVQNIDQILPLLHL